LGFRKLVVVDLRRPQSVDIKISRISDVAFVLDEPIVHLLDEKGIVAEITNAPRGVTHGLAMARGKLLVPLQAKGWFQIEAVPSLGGGAFKFEIVDIETDVIDDTSPG